MTTIPHEFPVTRPNTPEHPAAAQSSNASISSAQAAIASFPDLRLRPSQKRLIALPPQTPPSHEWPENWVCAGTRWLKPSIPHNGRTLNSLQFLGHKKDTQAQALTEKRAEQRKANHFPRLDQLLKFANRCETQQTDPQHTIRYLQRHSELCIAEQKYRNRSFRIEQSEPVLKAIERALKGATILLLDAEKDPTQHSRIFLSTFALFADQLDQSILQEWKSTLIVSFEKRIQKMHETRAINRLIALIETCTPEKVNRTTLLQELRERLEQYAIAQGKGEQEERFGEVAASPNSKFQADGDINCLAVHETVRTVILFLAKDSKEELERTAIFSQVMNASSEFLRPTTIRQLYNETVLWDLAYNALDHLINTVAEGTANRHTIIRELSITITRYVEITQAIDPQFSVKLDMIVFDSVQKTALFLCEKEVDMKKKRKTVNVVFEIYDKWLSAKDTRYLRNKTKLLYCANALKALEKETLLTPQQTREERNLSRYGDILVQYFQQHAPSKEEFHEILQHCGGIEASSDEDSQAEEEELSRILIVSQIDWDEKEE